MDTLLRNCHRHWYWVCCM